MTPSIALPSRRTTLLLLAALILLAAISLLAPSVARGAENWERFGQTKPKLGTLITIILYAPNEATAKAALDKAFARVDELDAILSDYRADSELSRLCLQSPHKTPVAVSTELSEVLQLSRDMHAQSEGAFDVTVGPLTSLWRQARRRKQMPPEAELQRALKSVGDRFVEFTPAKGKSPARVRLLQPKMRLDLGGVAKGFIVDEILASLADSGIPSALVNAGGDIGTSAPPPNSDGWNVGVAFENARGKPDRIVKLANAAVATSGDAFQSITIDGVRYSHILNPKTGVGLTQRSSVTVIAPTCAGADAWASALSVLGGKRGLALFPKERGFHARILSVDDGGEIRRVETEKFPVGEAVEQPQTTRKKKTTSDK